LLTEVAEVGATF